MKKKILFTICIAFFIGCNQIDIDKEHANNTWDEEFWQTLLQDSTFTGMGDLLNNALFFSKIISKTDSLSPDHTYNVIDKLQRERTDQVNSTISILKRKYSNYSPVYFQALYNLVNKPISRGSVDAHYELEEIQVLGDCSYAIATYSSIVSSINILRQKFAQAYPGYEYLFWRKLVNGMLVHNPICAPNEREGLNIIADNFNRIRLDCESTHELALKLKKCNTYMTKIRDFLSEAILNFNENNNDNFYDPTIPSPPSHAKGPQKHIQNKGDKLSLNKPNLTMPKQLPNTCVTSLMQLVSQELCGININEGKFITDYLKKYNSLILVDGVTLSNLSSFLETYFSIGDFNNIIKSIDTKEIVFTTIPSKIPKSRHFVLIIGYTSDGRYIYMDPEVGYLQDAPQQYFLPDINYSIKSCK